MFFFVILLGSFNRDYKIVLLLINFFSLFCEVTKVAFEERFGIVVKFRVTQLLGVDEYCDLQLHAENRLGVYRRKRMFILLKMNDLIIREIIETSYIYLLVFLVCETLLELEEYETFRIIEILRFKEEDSTVKGVIWL